MTNLNRKRLAVLSLCLLAGIAATPAMAEGDNYSRPPVRLYGTDMDYNTGNPMPTIAQEQARLSPAPVYNPATGTTTYYAPVYIPQVQGAAPAPVPVYTVPVAPAAYRPMALNQNQIETSLERQGYRRIKNVDFERGHFTARARDSWNRPVLLAVSAQTGQVLDIRYVR